MFVREKWRNCAKKNFYLAGGNPSGTSKRRVAPVLLFGPVFWCVLRLAPAPVVTVFVALFRSLPCCLQLPRTINRTGCAIFVRDVKKRKEEGMVLETTVGEMRPSNGHLPRTPPPPFSFCWAFSGL
ncbi:unnamed protein product [Ectocarpus sp. 12 AP-2014]